MLVPILVILSALVPATVAAAQTETPATSKTPATTGVRHYAVTLLSSFEPIPDALLPTDIKGHRIYRAQSVVFGKTIYFVRLGFFATSSEATALRDVYLARYPGAFMTEVTDDEYNAVVPAPVKVEKPVAPPAPKPAAPREQIYVITLATSATQTPTPAGPLPADLVGKRIYLHDSVQNGAKLHSLQLGFFASAAEAESAKNVLLSSYPEAQVRTASSQERDESARTLLATPASTAVEPASAPGAALPAVNASSDLETQASELIQKSRAAMTRNDNATAIQLLNQLLKLPPNSHSPEAQELIGLAHQRNGEIALAKREYLLCLKLYPDWPGAERVRQRLDDFQTAATTQTLTAPKKKETSISTVYGGLSQYYYRGNSRVDSTDTQIPNSPVPLPTFTALDQSAFITNLDITGRFRSGDFDNRVVLRDSYTLNLLPDTENVNRLYSAYAEVRNVPSDYVGRLGRQPGNSGGVLGRFDGVLLGYSVLPKWRINLVGGEPVEFNSIDSTKKFWGTSLDFGTFAEHWNGNVYYIYQTVDSITDRQAVGTELRYFDPTKSFFSLFDYDVSYGELNIALIQGNMQVGPKTNLNMLIDHRKAPILTTSNALIGSPITSISELLQMGISEDELRAAAVARTPTSDLYLIGATHNINPTWQLGGDVKVYNISATEASVINGFEPVLAAASTGNVLAFTLQDIATGLLATRDVSVLSLTRTSGQDYTANTFSFTNRTLLQDKWTFDLSLVYFKQLTNTEVETNRFTPILRVGYRWRDSITFELEAGLETGETVSAIQTDDISRNFFSIGYRWDF
jgi:tetratricopeptide (TPR) repeat protein